MKKFGFLIGFILIMMGSFYVFALPPLLEVIIKAEFTRKNVKLDSIGHMEIGINHVSLHNIILSKAPYNIEVSTINILNSPIILLIKKRAKALDIISAHIYVDLENDAITGQPANSPLTRFIMQPHSHISSLLDTAVLTLHRLSPSITFKNITLNVNTPHGLISVQGDCHISQDKVLASFSSIQRQLTFNAQISGKLNDNVELTSYIDNINLNIDGYKVKRGSGKFIYTANTKKKTGAQSFTAKAGMVKIKDLSLNNATLKSDSKENQNKIYIEATHSPKPTDKVQFWYNIVENQTTSFLQAQHIQADTIFDLYSQASLNTETAPYKKLISNLFIHPADITVQSTQNQNAAHFSASIMPDGDTALTKITIDAQHKQSPTIYIEPFAPNATQVKALAQHFIGVAPYEFSGEAQIFGHFGIDLLRGAIQPTFKHHDPLTLRLKNAAFKSDTASAKNLNGTIRLIQDSAAESSLSFGALHAYDLKLRDGRMNFTLSPNKNAAIKLQQLRATIGTGALTVQTGTLVKSYNITGKRVNASAIPQIFWPQNKRLSDLVDIDATLQTKPNGRSSALFNYQILRSAAKSNQAFDDIDSAHQVYPYLKFMEGTAP